MASTRFLTHRGTLPSPSQAHAWPSGLPYSPMLHMDCQPPIGTHENHVTQKKSYFRNCGTTAPTRPDPPPPSKTAGGEGPARPETCFYVFDPRSCGWPAEGRVCQFDVGPSPCVLII